MNTKTCSKCSRELPLEKFAKYKRRNKEYYSSCKNCKAEYRKANKEKLLLAKYEREAKNAERDKDKRRAWNALYYALRTGKISKPTLCETCCSAENIQAHHKDYSKPLEVNWVCQVCHAELDKQRRINYG